MSEKIVQFNEEIIKGQIKELVRGSVEETLNELHACSKKFEFYCLTSREASSSFSFFQVSWRIPRSFRYSDGVKCITRLKASVNFPALS